jgi:hypothetical protein
MATDTTLAGLDALDLGPQPGRKDAAERVRRVWALVWPKLAAVALVWVVWELVHLTGWKKYVLPGPGVTLSNLWDQAKTGLLWHAVGDTLLRAVLGYALAVLIGTIVGLLVARIRPLRDAGVPGERPPLLQAGHEGGQRRRHDQAPGQAQPAQADDPARLEQQRRNVVHPGDNAVGDGRGGGHDDDEQDR